jgi:hypothetical protein
MIGLNPMETDGVCDRAMLDIDEFHAVGRVT